MYRLTLVKGYNAEEIENYAKLVELGQPDFIEIKGVTFCGSSKGQRRFFVRYPLLTSLKKEGVAELCTRQFFSIGKTRQRVMASVTCKKSKKYSTPGVKTGLPHRLERQGNNRHCHVVATVVAIAQL